MQSELRAALADDLDQLIRLHDRELDTETLAALRAADFPRGLALLPDGEAGVAACTKMAAALAEAATVDDLAADYAAIYLNNSLGASPYESVWLDDEHLTCQQPMFELRETYAAAGFRVADRGRHDDHLVWQLHYLSRLLTNPAVDPEKPANFIDEHIGYWFPDFARRVALCCETPFYAALAELTCSWLIRFRLLLSEINSLPLPERKATGERIRRKLALGKIEVAPVRFAPGAQGASW